MPTLAAIHRYPIKSTAGESLDRARVVEEGLVHDRRFMVARPDGAFVTARRFPGLQRVAARFDGEQLTVMHDDSVALVESRGSFEQEPFDTESGAIVSPR